MWTKLYFWGSVIIWTYFRTINGNPQIIILLIKNIQVGKELLVDYGWKGYEGIFQATFCQCNSKNCCVIIENDVRDKLKELLQSFKKITNNISVCFDYSQIRSLISSTRFNQLQIKQKKRFLKI